MKILVATDNSGRSLKAVRKAAGLAEKEGTDVTLLSVAYCFTGEADEIPVSMQDSLGHEARKALQEGKTLFDGRDLEVKTILERGPGPANVMFDVVEEGKFDHIFLGSTR